ncbi:MAG TPA: hypothetical protein VJM46_03160 [Candidatus Saccharimonadales bacterium]|nr:hypothetical protein [Candidatus Saccharimonadales bacterium]
MGLFLKQDEQRSQLQSKIAADLQERMKIESIEGGDKKPQPAFLDNQVQTSSHAWIWILLGVVALIGAIIILR